MKKCFKCEKEKPLSEFYKHPKMADGHLNKCIECTKKESDDRFIELSKDPNFILSERERNRQRYHRLGYKEKYECRGEQKKQIDQRYFENNPEKRKAHIIIGNALRDGKITKELCEKCGDPETQAHHDDYSKPLEVNWLCVKHHNDRHVELRKQKLLNKNPKSVELVRHE